MDDSGPLFAATPDMSCCFVRAPLPVSQFKVSNLSLKSVPAAALARMSAAHCIKNVLPAVLVQAPSPPRLQSLLCTFLI